ncbi:MAG: TIGR03663 family protein, partial [Chloroflexi bacterium]|nr:TIGR03663 family protein [Chloroflexota bacterium]
YQFHGNALMYLIFGPSDWSVRLNAALCGTALIALPFLLRRQLGRVSALVLSGLLAFSPAFLYYSRFSREDIYFALWTMLFFVGFIRWLDARGGPGAPRWLLVAAAGFALSWATKESTAFITTPIVLGFLSGVFVVGYAYQFLASRHATSRPAGKGAGQRPAAHPLVATLGEFARANVPPLLAAFRGTPARAWVYALGVMAVIILVLYWPIGDPWQWGFWPGAKTVPVTLTKPVTHTTTYNIDAFTGGIQYWLQQQNESRGNQPWYYYFLVIPLYEQVAVVFGVGALVYYFLRRRTLFATVSGAAFLVCTGLTLFTGGMPGLQKLAALLMIVSGAALFVSRPRSLLVNLFLWWTVTTWGLYTFAGEKMPWLTLHILLPTMVLAALYIGHLFHSAPRLSKKWLITAGLLAVTALISFRSSVALAYVDGANPTEMLVYTQTAQDVVDVSKVIHTIPPQTITTGTKERVFVDVADEWPWVWY